MNAKVRKDFAVSAFFAAENNLFFLFIRISSCFVTKFLLEKLHVLLDKFRYAVFHLADERRLYRMRLGDFSRF